MPTPQRPRVAERANGQVNQLERVQVVRVSAAGVPTLVNPTAQVYTQLYTTASRAVSAYTANSQAAAYVGIATGVVGTPYAQLADLNALRVAYQTLRASHDNLLQVVTALIDDLQAFGLAR